MSSTPYNSALSRVPCREVRLPPVRMDSIEQADGSIVLCSSESLQQFDPNIPRNFLSMADKQPGKTLYAQRRRENSPEKPFTPSADASQTAAWAIGTI